MRQVKLSAKQQKVIKLIEHYTEHRLATSGLTPGAFIGAHMQESMDNRVKEDFDALINQQIREIQNDIRGIE